MPVVPVCTHCGTPQAIFQILTKGDSRFRKRYQIGVFRSPGIIRAGTNVSKYCDHPIALNKPFPYSGSDSPPVVCEASGIHLSPLPQERKGQRSSTTERKNAVRCLDDNEAERDPDHRGSLTDSDLYRGRVAISMEWSEEPKGLRVYHIKRPSSLRSDLARNTTMLGIIKVLSPVPYC